MDNIYFEKALETIYYRIMDGLPKEICNECRGENARGDYGNDQDREQCDDGQ